jgi:molybdopterin molybdotransferase
MGIAPDEPQALQAVFRNAAQAADVVISCGGVSVGEEDHVKGVVETLGRLQLWKIAIKPGKPLAFGEVCGKPFLGLPGNPSSVLVTCLVIARPFLFCCMGRDDLQPHPVREIACFSRRGGSREEYLRARRTPQGLELHGNQSSGVLASASWGDGLVRQPVGEDIEPLGLVEFLDWAHFR